MGFFAPVKKPAAGANMDWRYWGTFWRVGASKPGASAGAWTMSGECGDTIPGRAIPLVFLREIGFMIGRPVPATRPSLIVRLVQGNDEAAWNVFHRVYGPLIRRHCLRCGLQDADAAEVTQEVLLDVVRGISRFRYDPARGSFRGWLGTLTYRHLCRFWRRRRPASLDGSPHAFSIEDHRGRWNVDVDAHVLQQALQQVQVQVEGATWTAFQRTWLDGQPPADVALELNRSVDWVYVAKSRVLKRLRRVVEEQMENLALG